MNNIRRSRWSREIARGLALLFLLPLLLALPGKPAEGQTNIKEIAVMDFENPTGRQGAALGRKAADAVALALPPDRFSAQPREQVEKQIAALGLTTPLDTQSLLKLGKFMEEGVGLSQIVTGRVLRADVSRSTPRQAHVRIEIRVLDIGSEEYTNGAMADGVSTPRYDDVSSDVLIDEAVQKAAFSAVRQLVSQTISEGTVLMSKGGAITISLGERDGIVEGMEMIILRFGQKVARVRVTSTTDRDAEAKVIQETRGVMVEDKARVVYTSGAILAGGSAAQSLRRKVKWSTVVGTALGIGVAYWAVKLLRTRDPINQGAFGVRANSTLDGNGQPAVRIQWQRPANPGPPDLLGFVIWRSRAPYGSYERIDQADSPYELQFTDTTDARQVSFTQAGGTTTSTTSVAVAGVEPGVTYYYRISRLYIRRDTTTTGGTTGGTTAAIEESDKSEPSAGVTPLQRPAALAPAEGEMVDPDNITFRWYSVAGGDLYRVEASESPTFTGSRVFRSNDADPQMMLPSAVDGQMMAKTFNVSNVLGTTGTAGQTSSRQFFWRVGVRHVGDVQLPEGGFIYSPAVRIYTQELPPAQPAGQ